MMKIRKVSNLGFLFKIWFLRINLTGNHTRLLHLQIEITFNLYTIRLNQ